MRRTLIGLVLVSGCFGGNSTGAYAIRGVLLSHEGTPVSNQRVESLEHGVRTGKQGDFLVRWAAPNQFVTIDRGGVAWKRVWQPGTDPATVRVRLPETDEGEIVCRTEVPCMAELTWEGEPGLTGRVEVPCGPKTPVNQLRGLPAAEPEVACSTVLGDLPLDLTREGERLTIRDRPRPRPVDLDDAVETARTRARAAARAAGAEPGDVRVDCLPRILDGDVVEGIGVTGIRPTGSTWAWAVCRCSGPCGDFPQGRIGAPVVVTPRPGGVTDDQARVELPWSPEGMTLSLDPPVAEPRTLHLLRQDGQGGVDWEVVVEAVDQGTYRLPELPRGRYLLGLGAASVMGRINPPEPEIPGTVVFHRQSGTWGVDGGYVGALRLEEDGLGELEVDGHPPPEAP